MDVAFLDEVILRRDTNFNVYQTFMVPSLELSLIDFTAHINIISTVINVNVFIFRRAAALNHRKVSEATFLHLLFTTPLTNRR